MAENARRANIAVESFNWYLCVNRRVCMVGARSISACSLSATLFTAQLRKRWSCPTGISCPGSFWQHPLSSSVVAKAYEDGPRRAALGTYNFAGDVGKALTVRAHKFSGKAAEKIAAAGGTAEVL